MQKIAYIHAGPYKTATSSIQKFLSDHLDLLKSNQITFPTEKVSKLFGNNHSHIFSGAFNDDIEYQLWIKYGHKNVKHSKPEALLELSRILESTPTNILFSGEDIVCLSPKEVKTMINFIEGFGFKIRVICFIRDAVDHAESFAQQLVRGRGFSLENVVEEPPVPRYRAWFEKFYKIHSVDFRVHKYLGDCDFDSSPLGCLLKDIDPSKELLEAGRNFNVRAAKGYSLPALILLNSVNYYSNLLGLDSDLVDEIKNIAISVRGPKFRYANSIRQRIIDLSEHDRCWLFDELNIKC